MERLDHEQPEKISSCRLHLKQQVERDLPPAATQLSLTRRYVLFISDSLVHLHSLLIQLHLHTSRPQLQVPSGFSSTSSTGATPLANLGLTPAAKSPPDEKSNSSAFLPRVVETEQRGTVDAVMPSRRHAAIFLSTTL